MQHNNQNKKINQGIKTCVYIYFRLYILCYIYNIRIYIYLKILYNNKIYNSINIFQSKTIGFGLTTFNIQTSGILGFLTFTGFTTFINKTSSFDCFTLFEDHGLYFLFNACFLRYSSNLFFSLFFLIFSL